MQIIIDFSLKKETHKMNAATYNIALLFPESAQYCVY